MLRGDPSGTLNPLHGSFSHHFFSPLNNLLIQPKFPHLAPNIPYRQHHWRLRAFIYGLAPSPLCHIRIHKARATTIDQHPGPLPPLLQRDRPSHANNASLTHSISGAGPALFLLLAFGDSGCEGLHQFRNVLNGLGACEGAAQVLGVFGAQMPDHTSDVDEAASGPDKGQEGGGGELGAVVVALEGLGHDVDVCVRL